jgi:hypothetical protein
VNGLGDPDAGSAKYPPGYSDIGFPVDSAELSDDAASESSDVCRYTGLARLREIRQYLLRCWPGLFFWRRQKTPICPEAEADVHTYGIGLDFHSAVLKPSFVVE